MPRRGGTVLSLPPKSSFLAAKPSDPESWPACLASLTECDLALGLSAVCLQQSEMCLDYFSNHTRSLMCIALQIKGNGSRPTGPIMSNISQEDLTLHRISKTSSLRQQYRKGLPVKCAMLATCRGESYPAVGICLADPNFLLERTRFKGGALPLWLPLLSFLLPSMPPKLFPSSRPVPSTRPPTPTTPPLTCKRGIGFYPQQSNMPPSVGMICTICTSLM